MRRTATLVVLIFLLLSTNISLGQGESDNWYFGNGAGVNFSTGSPVVLSNGVLYNTEGVATISDPQGNLLFYTDGRTVYDSTHSVMPNGTGLLGHASSTQSGVIIPNPGNPDIYYIFTTDAQGLGNGARYSEVDMTLNGGLGDVTSKNVLLFVPTCERVTAVRHSNNTDIWAITQPYGRDSIYSYLVTSAGVSASPVRNNTGRFFPIPLFNGYNAIGYMKSSPDGKLLGIADHGTDTVSLYHFDAATGVVTLWFNILLGPLGFNNSYGLEFSPDNSKLYITAEETTINGRKILQFDLSSGSPSAIAASMYVVNQGVINPAWGIQTAKDLKIYSVNYTRNYLDVINNPNFAGAACNYQDTAIIFTGTGQLGLPNFITSFFNDNNFTFTGRCLTDTTFFTLTGGQVDSVWWDFGDTASGSLNNSNATDPLHYYADTGDYAVTLIVYIDTFTDTLVQIISIDQYPEIDLGPDTVLCNANLYVINQNNVLGDFSWNDGDTNKVRVLFPDQSGTYWLLADNNGCTDSDTVRVLFVEDTIPLLPNDTSICGDETLSLEFPVSDSVSYLWQDGDTSADYAVADTGLYWLEITTPFCTKRDSFHVSRTGIPPNLLPEDTAICVGTTLHLNACVPGATSYLWSTGHLVCSPNFNLGTISKTFVFWVDITIGNCTFRDSIFVEHAPVFWANPLPGVLSGCHGDTIKVPSPFHRAFDILWSDSTTADTLFATTSGTYWLQLTTSQCFVDDSMTILIAEDFSDLLGEDTVVCFADSLLLNPVVTGTGTYLWWDGSTDSTNWTTASGTGTMYWVSFTKDGCEARDTINVLFAGNDSILLPSDATICVGDSIAINLPVTDSAVVIWSDGSMAKSRVLNTAGIYWVQVNSGGCILNDTIVLSNFSLPPSLFDSDTTLCFGESLLLDATTTNASYLWSTGSSDSSIVIDISNFGLIWVERTISNCEYYDTIEVDFVIDTGSILTNDTFFCVGDTWLISLRDTGVTYLWQNTDTGSTYSISTGGQYWVVRNDAGCLNHDTIKVVYDSIVQPILGSDTVLCSFDNIVLNASVLNASYLWNTLAVTPSISITQFGQYWVELSVGACSERDTINIIQDSIAIDVFPSDSTICEGDIITLDATTENATYQWQDLSTMATYDVTGAGLYWVEVNVDGCTDRDSITVNQTTFNADVLDDAATICENESIVLDATIANATYLWNDNSTQSSLTVNNAGIYWVDITVENCTERDSISVSVSTLPTDLIPITDTTMCPVDLLIDAAAWGQSWQWQNGNTGPTFQANQPGLYWVIATDLPCEYRDSITIIEDCPDTIPDTIQPPPNCKIRIPTAISANGNNINDCFEIFVTECAVAHYEMQIYNRWGEMVFQTFDPNNFWDATYKGEPVPVAVYVYSLVIIDEAGRRYQKKGNVTVLR